MFFKNMPKIELHVHVEGAVNAETYFRLAQENNVKLPVSSFDEWQKFFEFKDFAHFIKVYITAVSSIKKPSDYSFLVEEFYKNQKEQKIIYTEAYLSASFLVDKFDDDEILDALALGMKTGEEKYGVKVNFIPDIARNIPDSQDRVLELILKGKERGIFIGIGLGGMESGFPPEIFTETYKKAKHSGLHLLVHAGEAAGPESIWGAINSLGAERIGHGIRCLEDEKLVAYLKENNLHIEVSPVSNYCLKLIDSNSPHPIKNMLELGLNCSVNSDDPAMFSTNLTEQYVLLTEQGFSVDQLIQLNKNALAASFLNEEEKLHYLGELIQWENTLK